MGKGQDIDNDTKIRIYGLSSQGKSAYFISKQLKITYKTVKRWIERREEILKTGNLSSKRKGVVGRKKVYSPRSAKKLVRKLEKKGMTQVRLAKEEGRSRSTIIKATRKTKDNPQGAHPYKPQKTPQSTPATKQQLFEYTKRSPIGKAARRSKSYWDREKLKWGFVDHSSF